MCPDPARWRPATGRATTPGMSIPPPPPPPGARPAKTVANTAGGFLVALGAMIGAAIGFFVGEATPGFLIGLAVGAVGAALVWWRGRG